MADFRMCLGNDQFHLVLAKNNWFVSKLMVQEVEAVSLLKAIQWAIEMSLEYVYFQLECKIVVDT